MSVNDVEVNTPQEAVQALASATAATPASATSTAMPASAPAAPPAPEFIPRLADGIELIGEFEDSGFKEPPYIARRADGQVVQMPRMLFALAEQIDGRAGVDELAERFSHAIERNVQPADVDMLIRERLIPLAVVASAPDGDSVELGKVDPLLALKFRTAVIPDRAVRSITSVFLPLFFAPAMAVAALAFVGLDGWLFFVHGISQSLRHVLYQPALMLMLIGGVVLATAFHEIGHATACRYGGARPGVMGVGIYLVWPAFYTDITDAYRLGKWGRLRTDVGGMYFNAIFALVMGAVYAATSFEPLLLLIVLQTFAIIQQALPLLRLDGYYILSDLTGVPDIYLRIRSVLTSLIPGRKADPKVSELRGWVRAIVTVYVLLMVLFIGVVTLGLIINLPRVVATGYDSAALHFQAVSPAFRAGQPLRGVLDVIQALFLVLPAAGLLFTGVRIGRRVGGGTIRWTTGHPLRQALLASGAAVAVVLAALSWWPNGQYRPIQPGERGTLEGLIQQVRALPTARPSLTAERQRQLGGAPTERSRLSQSAGSSPPPTSHPSSPAVGATGHSTQSTTTPSDTQTTSGSSSTTSTTSSTSSEPAGTSSTTTTDSAASSPTTPTQTTTSATTTPTTTTTTTTTSTTPTSTTPTSTSTSPSATTTQTTTTTPGY